MNEKQNLFKTNQDEKRIFKKQPSNAEKSKSTDAAIYFAKI